MTEGFIVNAAVIDFSVLSRLIEFEMLWGRGCENETGNEAVQGKRIRNCRYESTPHPLLSTLSSTLFYSHHISAKVSEFKQNLVICIRL